MAPVRVIITEVTGSRYHIHKSENRKSGSGFLFLFCLLCVRFEVEYRGVHAEAFAGGWWPVVEDVAEMRFAPSALHLNTLHAM